MATYAEFKGYPGLIGWLRRIGGMHRSPEFRSMLGQVRKVLDDDWKMRVLAGIDGQGRDVPDQSGIRSRREGRYRGATGAPGTPHGRRSRLYSQYRSTMTGSGSTFTYVGRVEGVPFARYPIARFRYAGVSPRAQRDLRRVVADSTLKLLRSGPSA